MTGRHRAERPEGYWQAIDQFWQDAPRPTAEQVRRAQELLAEYAIAARAELAVSEEREQIR